MIRTKRATNTLLLNLLAIGWLQIPQHPLGYRDPLIKDLTREPVRLSGSVSSVTVVAGFLSVSGGMSRIIADTVVPFSAALTPVSQWVSSAADTLMVFMTRSTGLWSCVLVVTVYFGVGGRSTCY